MTGHVIRIGFGLFFCYLAYLLFVGPIFILSLIPLMLAFVCLYTYLGDFIAEPFANLYFSGRGGSKAPEQFSKVHGLLSNRQFSEAVEELRQLTAQSPDLIAGKVLLVNTLYENLNSREEALEIAFAELESEKWNDEHGKIVMTSVDILLEKGDKETAISLLEKAVIKLKKSSLCVGLERRLKSLATQ